MILIDSKADSTIRGRQEVHQEKGNASSDLGPLKDNERQDINCAVKEYLLIAGYRLTAMTFYEEVYTMQDYGFFVLLSYDGLPFVVVSITVLEEGCRETFFGFHL